MCEYIYTLKSPQPHRSSFYWHHHVPGVIKSAHLESHLADGQRFSVLGVNIFAHLRVRDPIVEGAPSVAQSEFVEFVDFVGYFLRG